MAIYVPSYQGVLEECGFRFLYICLAMLSLVLMDYFIKGNHLCASFQICNIPATVLFVPGMCLALACLTFYIAAVLVVGIARRPLNQITLREVGAVLGTLGFGATVAYGGNFGSPILPRRLLMRLVLALQQPCGW